MTLNFAYWNTLPLKLNEGLHNWFMETLIKNEHNKSRSLQAKRSPKSWKQMDKYNHIF